MQTRTDITALVVTVLAAKLSLEPSEITDDAVLDDLGADSLTLVDLALELEKNLPVSVPEGVLDSSQTVAEAVAAVAAQAPAAS